MSQAAAAEADELADLVNQITSVRIDPERFHVQRDEVAKRLRRLAEQLRGQAGRVHTTTWRPDGQRKR